MKISAIIYDLDKYQVERTHKIAVLLNKEFQFQKSTPRKNIKSHYEYSFEGTTNQIDVLFQKIVGDPQLDSYIWNRKVHTKSIEIYADTLFSHKTFGITLFFETE